jgi:hypothetical protein
MRPSFRWPNFRKEDCIQRHLLWHELFLAVALCYRCWNKLCRPGMGHHAQSLAVTNRVTEQLVFCSDGDLTKKLTYCISAFYG